MSSLLDTSNLYRPRTAWFVKRIACGPVEIKLSAISAPDTEIRETDILRAEDAIREESAKLVHSYDHMDAGFAIVHAGEEALWLLLHHWIDGGIATHRLWRKPLETEAPFQPVVSSAMACVWELGVIDFERRAWMSTVMAGKPLSDYLARTLPHGTV
ncbi:hypothetical protein [Pelagibacterium luteolum]|uniref:Uncharacterized protein n=1 Tax=Pelagibacterium luteolum TaxID=440168 RepID=A0A1G7YWZ9_9HYPH|nr:hypothetical protein SAMN04487974_11635 [Pelagibacterium luteolum]